VLLADKALDLFLNAWQNRVIAISKCIRRNSGDGRFFSSTCRIITFDFRNHGKRSRLALMSVDAVGLVY